MPAISKWSVFFCGKRMCENSDVMARHLEQCSKKPEDLDFTPFKKQRKSEDSSSVGTPSVLENGDQKEVILGNIVSGCVALEEKDIPMNSELMGIVKIKTDQSSMQDPDKDTLLQKIIILDKEKLMLQEQKKTLEEQLRSTEIQKMQLEKMTRDLQEERNSLQQQLHKFKNSFQENPSAYRIMNNHTIKHLSVLMDMWKVFNEEEIAKLSQNNITEERIWEQLQEKYQECAIGFVNETFATIDSCFKNFKVELQIEINRQSILLSQMVELLRHASTPVSIADMCILPIKNVIGALIEKVKRCNEHLLRISEIMQGKF